MKRSWVEVGRWVQLSAGAVIVLTLTACIPPRDLLTEVAELVQKATGPDIEVLQEELSIPSGSTAWRINPAKIGESSETIFTIRNTGKLALLLTGTPEAVSKISGSYDSMFDVVSPPTTPVAAGDSTTFTMRFSPPNDTSPGDKRVTISVQNNDDDENPYQIGLVAYAGTAPKILIRQGSTDIPSGGSYDFGNTVAGTARPVEFTVYNVGTEALNLTDTPQVALIPDPPEFEVTTQPADSVAVGGNSPFTITFSAAPPLGPYNTTVSIGNNDSTKDPYTFGISGTVIPAALSSIIVTPADRRIGVGTSLQFTATGHYTDNSEQSITSQVVWTSSNTAIATISSAGLASGLSMDGPVTITATLGEVNGSTSLTVVDYFSRTYGGVGSDSGYVIRRTADGGFVVGGVTNSFGAGDLDFWIIRIAPDGVVLWQKAYGGVYWDYLYSLELTSDGGIVAAGWTKSLGDAAGDAWVLRLDASGSVVWEKAYTTGGHLDSALSISQTPDGYIVAGETNPTADAGYDAWLLKLKTDGTVDWAKRYYYGGGGESFSQVVLLSNGSYIVVGTGGGGLQLTKLDSSGGVTWQKTYSLAGGSGTAIVVTSDGGYAVAGQTTVLGGGLDFWVLRLNNSGDILNDSNGEPWQKAYGGTANDSVYSIQQTQDGGFLVAGASASLGSPNNLPLILRLDSNGEVLWQKTYAVGSSGGVGSVLELPTLQLVGTGWAQGDVWLYRLTALGVCAPIAQTSFIPTPPTVTAASASTSSPLVENTATTAMPIGATVTITNATVIEQSP